jgi:hypothetical protein
MGDRLLTEAGEDLFRLLRPELQNALEPLERAHFNDATLRVHTARTMVSSANRAGVSEDTLNDYFVLDRYVDLIESYIQFWRLVWDGNYPGSWNSLQDVLDDLRIIKKFSTLDVSFFEDQMLELESGYPYKVFASIGAIVDHFECSICGKDIDGFECKHRRGELYGGHMAIGIARDMVSLDHVSLVLSPEDKRCVIQLENTPHKFPVLGYIREQWRQGTLRIGYLRRLEWSRRMIINPEYREVGRNDRCFCGKEQKFKYCCIGKRYVEQDHVELVGERCDIRSAVV